MHALGVLGAQSRTLHLWDRSGRSGPRRVLWRACEPMKIIPAISSPEHDEVTQKVLRHLKLWAPPQSARKHSAAEPIDPQPDMGDHAVNPPWVDDV